jgi:dual specificity phosphatase 3
MADFSKITERLFCGGAIESAADVAELIEAGVTHVINARQTRSEESLIKALCWRSSTKYLWNPTKDDDVHPKPVAWFGNAVRFALATLAHPRTIVLTHCRHGKNRGPSLAYAILRAHGWPRHDAYILLKEKRPHVIVGYRDDADAALTALGWTK